MAYLGKQDFPTNDLIEQESEKENFNRCMNEIKSIAGYYHVKVGNKLYSFQRYRLTKQFTEVRPIWQHVIRNSGYKPVITFT